MRKTFALLAAMCWFGVLLGCGGNTERQIRSSAMAEVLPNVSASGGTSEAKPRIIATTVSSTEMMDLLDLDLVGIPTSTKVLPERYAQVEKVGNPMSPDMEKLKSLKPSEVLSVTTLKYELEPLFKSAGVEATFLDLTSLQNLEDSVVLLGEKYDRREQADKLIARYENKITEVKAAIAGKPAPKVLILLGVPGSYLVATEHSYIGDLVKIAGGVNIVQGETVEYLASNTEYLQQANPDVILRAAHGMPEEVVKMFNEDFIKNDIWKHFNAVRNNRVYDLPEELFGTTANLAADRALTELLPMLYPETE
ncbi:heme ABC transporter substrate-binding protein IsdE [Paenibacillus albidus]|uniref:High-affinity heme uptake system protein IsdE n=1 Tax=Paenibacillus albidus TaxID=2041023 RepID=A0A917FKR7_9BACL|nr:heme ABC transporter substrate-binding protein IsdE [Paenibacillus albidus]GGF88477.1 heme ABC transporter substrate-binding protein IsdE [Paenibacillus albidus]